MMKIYQATLHKIAHLARLEINPEKEKEYIADLEQVLSWVQKLDELDTDGVEPLTNMSFESNVLRADEAHHTIAREDALKLAPKRDDQFFRVPKVLD